MHELACPFNSIKLQIPVVEAIWWNHFNYGDTISFSHLLITVPVRWSIDVVHLYMDKNMSTNEIFLVLNMMVN
jgi:hypothetical protein